MRLNLIYFPAILFLLSCCTSPKESDSKFKIAVLKYAHETCTFCPGGDTEIEDWEKYSPPLKGEELLQSGSYIKGFVSRARSYPDVELIGLTSPVGVFGGSSRSWNSEESFDHFMGLMLDDLKKNLPVDGVYLSLHGAMATRNIPRPEAEIAKRIREVVGDKVPIVGTFDLHGNEDEEFLKWANGAFVTKRYPHYDAYLQGERAAHFLRENIRGTYRSTTATRKPPVVTATVLQWTGQSPSMDIMERARRWESRIPDVFVSVFYGYPWSDVPDIGTTVHVMTNNNQQLADSIADDMEAFIWRVKEGFALGDFLMPDQAVTKTVEAIERSEVPVVLAEHSDRPGDATWVLKELIKNKVSGVLYGALTDSRVLDELYVSEAKPGDPFEGEVGGYTGESAGSPVKISGTIKYMGPFGNYDKTAFIEWGDDNMLILTPAYEQTLYPEDFRVGPVNPDDYQVFVVKSRVHFRRGFDETGYAKSIFIVESPGPWVGTTKLDALPYEFGPIENLYPFRPGDPRRTR